MSRHRNYVIRRTDNGKCWDFKECAWVEKVNDCCKITEYVAFLLVRLSEEVVTKLSNKEEK